jgi:hypothetical protein
MKHQVTDPGQIQPVPVRATDVMPRHRDPITRFDHKIPCWHDTIVTRIIPTINQTLQGISVVRMTAAEPLLGE